MRAWTDGCALEKARCCEGERATEVVAVWAHGARWPPPEAYRTRGHDHCHILDSLKGVCGGERRTLGRAAYKRATFVLCTPAVALMWVLSAAAGPPARLNAVPINRT